MAFSGGGTPTFRVAMERQFRCAAAGSANGRVTANVPVYRYIFANNKPGATRGATHGDEVSFVFVMGNLASLTFSSLCGLSLSRTLSMDLKRSLGQNTPQRVCISSLTARVGSSYHC